MIFLRNNDTIYLQQGNYIFIFIRKNYEIFFDALISDGKNANLPEEYDFFSGLIGSWKIEYIDKKTEIPLKGEWHFARVLDGMAIQDVIIIPSYESGITLRVFNPNKKAWDVTYSFVGRVIRLEANIQDGKIVLDNIDNENRKWVFVKIEDNNFRWLDVSGNGCGEWRVDFEIIAQRM